MRTSRIAVFIFAAAFLSGVSVAQQTPDNPSGATDSTQQPTPQTPQSNAATSGSHNLRIAPGSVIPVQLTKGIDAKKAKAGDAVEARVTIDMKTNSGEVIVPKDTKVVGHVTEAQAHSKDQQESQIGLAFDHAVMKDGQDVSLPMSIQAIISPQALNQGNSGSNDSAPAASDSGYSPSGTSGRSGSMGNSSPNRAPSSSATANEPQGSSGNGSANNHSNPPITGNTQGVVGISDITLSAPQGNQGSVVTSEKKNVKLDNGTLMLLRVSQEQMNQLPANQPPVNQPQQ